MIAPVCGEAHCFEGPSALRMQGAAVAPRQSSVAAAVSVQPDHLPALEAAAAAAAKVAPLPAAFAFPGRRGFAFHCNGLVAVVYADAGAVLRADPRRVVVAEPSPRCFARSLLAMARGGADGDSATATTAEARLRELQRETSALNIAAWAQQQSASSSSSSAYDAWVRRFGPPAVQAAAVAADPGARLGRPLLRALLPPLAAAAAAGRAPRVANLMGSHGAKALALALLPPPPQGGDATAAAAAAAAAPATKTQVTVVDGSAENARYGREVAEAAGAGASVEYLVADVLDEEALFGGGGRAAAAGSPAAAGAARAGAFDAVFLELGCLHYFLDPLPLFRVAARLLRPDGGGASPAARSRLVVRDFHPASAKLLDAPPRSRRSDEAARAARRVAARRAARKGRLRVGDYFSEALVEVPVAYSKHHEQRGGEEEGDDGGGGGGGDPSAAPVVLLRQHTLGDIVTAAARAGLAVESLEEEGGTRVEEDAGVPKLFTLVCTLR